jgi:hypothetical protein
MASAGDLEIPAQLYIKQIILVHQNNFKIKILPVNKYRSSTSDSVRDPSYYVRKAGT